MKEKSFQVRKSWVSHIQIEANRLPKLKSKPGYKKNVRDEIWDTWVALMNSLKIQSAKIQFLHNIQQQITVG